METREWEQKWDGPSLNQSHIYTFAKSVALSLSWHHTWFVLQGQNKGTSAIEVGRTNDCIACSSVASYLAATQSVHTSTVVTHVPMVIKQLCLHSVRLWICCSSHVPMFSNCQLFDNSCFRYTAR